MGFVLSKAYANVGKKVIPKYYKYLFFATNMLDISVILVKNTQKLAIITILRKYMKIS